MYFWEQKKKSWHRNQSQVLKNSMYFHQGDERKKKPVAVRTLEIYSTDKNKRNNAGGAAIPNCPRTRHESFIEANITEEPQLPFKKPTKIWTWILKLLQRTSWMKWSIEKVIQIAKNNILVIIVRQMYSTTSRVRKIIFHCTTLTMRTDLNDATVETAVSGFYNLNLV